MIMESGGEPGFDWWHPKSGVSLKMVMDHQDHTYTFETSSGERIKYHYIDVKKLPELW